MEGGNRVIIDASPIIDFAQESGRKNTAAAQWSATAAGLGFLVGVLSAYATWPLHIHPLHVALTFPAVAPWNPLAPPCCTLAPAGSPPARASGAAGLDD
jgi:hypothetical protein